MGNYKVKKGDSWIKIANDNNISLNDLLYWNGIDPQSRGALPMLKENMDVYVANPYNITPSVVTADAPENYAEYGSQGMSMLDNYALAVKQGQMKFNEVPKAFQNAVNQRMITMGTDKFAGHTLNVGSNIAMFLANPVAYVSSLAAQKGTAYAVDKISGRNDYGAGDFFGYTPIVGREYAQEHPGTAVAVDALTGIFGGGFLRNLKNIANPAWRQAFSLAVKSNAQNATGLTNDLVHSNPVSTITRGNIFKSGTKGFGKTGNKVAGSPSVGYKSVSTPKGTFNHSASTAVSPGGLQTVTYSPVTPMPEVSIPMGMPIATVPVQPDPPVTVVRPEKHIYEQQSFNGWQQPNPTGEIGEFQPGTAVYSISGEAPIGSTIDSQALVGESLNLWNTYLPRKAVYVPGGAPTGTPSNIHSGLGIVYGSENPGNLIIK